jgi:hypothetical protein
MVTRHLSELSRAGMSRYGIAAELYRRKISAVKGIHGALKGTYLSALDGMF